MMDLANLSIAWCRSPEYRDLTTRQIAILAIVSAGPTRVKDIAAAIGVQKPVVSRAADKLVSEQVRPAIASAYETGRMPSMLPDYSGERA